MARINILLDIISLLSSCLHRACGLTGLQLHASTWHPYRSWESNQKLLFERQPGGYPYQPVEPVDPRFSRRHCPYRTLASDHVSYISLQNHENSRHENYCVYCADPLFLDRSPDNGRCIQELLLPWTFSGAIISWVELGPLITGGTISVISRRSRGMTARWEAKYASHILKTDIRWVMESI